MPIRSERRRAATRARARRGRRPRGRRRRRSPSASSRDRIDARRVELGSTRRLVMIEGAQHRRADRHLSRGTRGGTSACCSSTATRSGRGTAMRSSSGSTPTSSRRRDGGSWQLDERRIGTRHSLHPDLAMLASTSGSTGSPKLVRLSRENLLSNAVAIGDYLNLGAADRAITTLPLHYCYGLSVVNSHLAAGASTAPHRAVGRRGRVLARVRRGRRDVVRRRALHIRHARGRGLRRARPADACATSRRPAAGSIPIVSGDSRASAVSAGSISS